YTGVPHRKKPTYAVSFFFVYWCSKCISSATPFGLRCLPTMERQTCLYTYQTSRPIWLFRVALIPYHRLKASQSTLLILLRCHHSVTYSCSSQGDIPCDWGCQMP